MVFVSFSHWYVNIFLLERSWISNEKDIFLFYYVHFTSYLLSCFILFEKSMSPEKGICLEIIMQHFFKPIFICKDLFPKQIFHFKSFTSALQVWNHQQFVLPHKSWTQSWFILLIIKQGIFIIDRSPLNFLKFLYRGFHLSKPLITR